MFAKFLLKRLIPIATIFCLSTAMAFDFKSCKSAKFERDDFDNGMLGIFTQVMQLSDAGRKEEVNFEALAYLSAAVDAYAIGFNATKGILISAKFPTKEDDALATEAFLNLTRGYTHALERLNDMINANVAFVKNQSVRDDLKALVIKNKNQLRRLSPCVN
jgi:hypothetical protein